MNIRIHKFNLKTVVVLIALTFIFITLYSFKNNNLTVYAEASVLNNETSGKDLVAKMDNFSFVTKERIPSTLSWGMDNDYGCVAQINEFWGVDGNYHVVYSGEKKIYISILSQQMELLKTLEITKDLPIVGNAIQDLNGNYYIVYGKYDTEGDLSDADVGTKTVMTIVQYSSNGDLLKGLTYMGKDTFPYGDVGSGTKEPFNFANCDLIIDKSGVLVCRYGRVMYNGHQSSHALYVNTNTMTKLNYVAPYNSHSFDQKVLLTSDGGYLFAERGDAYDRGIIISKVSSSTKDMWSYPKFTPFHFRSGYIYQTTYATIAGIAECSNGYALAGSSEKTLSYENAKNSTFNESRNIFMQVFSKDFNSSATNNSNVQLLQGESRIAEGTYVSGLGLCQEGAKDYGILWLTDYTGSFYASNPKLVKIGNDQLLIMWEKKKYNEDDWSNPFIESYYMVVSSDGTIIIPQTIIQDVQLTEYGEPDYKEGCIYWSSSDGVSRNFMIHRLVIGETMKAKIHVSALKVKQSTIIVRAGEEKEIEVSITPADADNKHLRYDINNTDIINVDENGSIKVKDIGETEVTIYSEENENIFTSVTIYTTNNAPSNLKVINYGEIVKLSWNKTKFNKGYQIYRSTAIDKGYKYIGETNQLSYYDDEVSDGKIYYYKVKSSNEWWEEDQSQNPFSRPEIICVQSPPGKIVLEKISKTTAQITWTKANNASGYEIYCYDLDTQKYKLIKTITGNSIFTFKKYKLKSGQTHMFKVRAYTTKDGVIFYSSFTKIVRIKM